MKVPLPAGDGVSVLLFHGVIAAPRAGIRNYTGKHIALDAFVRILSDLLERGGTPVSLNRARRWLAGGDDIPPGAFCVTFDDGFENNASVAAPALAELGIPATFYVTTDFVENGTGSWTDMLECCVEATARASVVAPGLGHRPLDTPARRIALLDELRALLKSDPARDPYEYAQALAELLGVPAALDDPALDRKLSWDQIRALHADDRFDVGAHGKTHRVLAFLSPDELVRELSVSLSIMRERLGGPVDHLSYPEGTPAAVSAAVVRAAAASGVRCGLTTDPAPVRSGDDPMRLPRYLIA